MEELDRRVVGRMMEMHFKGITKMADVKTEFNHETNNLLV